MLDPAGVSLREATLDDCVAVSALMRGLGLWMPPEPDAVRHSWEWLWTHNPTVTSGLMSGRPGWVLESEDEVVGFFGTLPRRYRLGEETVRVAAANAWAVQRPFRTRTNDLAKEYFGQPGADVWLVNTAIQPAVRIFIRFGSLPMPQRDYTRVLYWVLDASGFLGAAFRKVGVRPPLAAAGRVAFSPLLAAGSALRGRPGRLRAGLDAETIPLADVGDEFDELWRRRLAEGGRRIFYACRSAEDIRWHFGLATERGKATVLCCRRGGRLDGYLVLLRDTAPGSGLRRARIADLFVASDDLAVVDALLAAAYEQSRSDGCHVLEWVGMPRPLREHVARYRPFARTLPTEPFHFRTLDTRLSAELQQEERWYPSFYDADSSLG